MRKITYILLMGLIFSTLGCEKNTDVKKVADFFKSDNDKTELRAKLDFTLSDSTLIKSIEKQIKVDLCDKNKFTGVMEYKNMNLEFPAIVFKNCDEKIALLHNVIEINISIDNKVLVSGYLVENDESLESKLISVTKDMIEGLPKRNTLLYNIDWETKTEPQLIKKRLFEILKTIRNHSNELSIKDFNKNLSELTKEEIVELKKEYSGIILINDYFPELTTPPPPLPKEKIE